MLNSLITKDINLRDPAGGPPKGKNALFMGFDGGKLRLMQLKVRLQCKRKLESMTDMMFR